MTESLVLERHRFASLRGARRLHVTQGTLWITIDHDRDDHVLVRGQSIDLPARAHALVEALDAPARACVDQSGRWWQRLARALHVRPAASAGRA